MKVDVNTERLVISEAELIKIGKGWEEQSGTDCSRFLFFGPSIHPNLVTAEA